MSTPDSCNCRRFAAPRAYTSSAYGDVPAGRSISGREMCKKLAGRPRTSARASSVLTTSYGGAMTSAAHSARGRRAANGLTRFGIAARYRKSGTDAFVEPRVAGASEEPTSALRGMMVCRALRRPAGAHRRSTGRSNSQLGRDTTCGGFGVEAAFSSTDVGYRSATSLRDWRLRSVSGNAEVPSVRVIDTPVVQVWLVRADTAV